MGRDAAKARPFPQKIAFQYFLVNEILSQQAIPK